MTEINRRHLLIGAAAATIPAACSVEQHHAAWIVILRALRLSIVCRTKCRTVLVGLSQVGQELLIEHSDELVEGALVTTRNAVNWARVRMTPSKPLARAEFAGVPVIRTIDVATGRIEGELYGTQTTFPKNYSGSYEDFAPTPTATGLKRIEITTNLGTFEAGKSLVLPEEDRDQLGVHAQTASFLGRFF